MVVAGVRGCECVLCEEEVLSGRAITKRQRDAAPMEQSLTCGGQDAYQIYYSTSLAPQPLLGER